MKSLIALAIVNKKKPKLNVNDIYPLSMKKEIVLLKEEKIIRVEIKEIK